MFSACHPAPGATIARSLNSHHIDIDNIRACYFDREGHGKSIWCTMFTLIVFVTLRRFPDIESTAFGSTFGSCLIASSVALIYSKFACNYDNHTRFKYMSRELEFIVTHPWGALSSTTQKLCVMNSLFISATYFFTHYHPYHCPFLP